VCFFSYQIGMYVILCHMLIYDDPLYINSGIRTWGVCPCKNSSPEWEASSTNVEAGLALLAYMGVEI
jgi:hypothetical protein